MLLCNHIGLEFGNFLLNYFELSQFTFEEGAGDVRLFLDAARGQLIEISDLIVGITEILDLDRAHFNQGLQTVVGLTQGYAHEPGQIPLADFGLLLNDFKDAVAGVQIHGKHLQNATNMGGWA